MSDATASKIRRILFVDDEERVLQGIQRQLRPMRKEWDVKIAVGGQAALAILEAEPIDVVVSDMRMPGMDGATFLHAVMDKWPQTVRIILSGQADRESIMRSISATHQYLAKPCDPDRLRSAVSRACALRDIIYDEGLQRLVASMETIPSLPGLYEQINTELNKEDPSIKAIGDIVSMDLGMSAKLLQLVNSARFGLSRQVNSSGEAVSLLGIATVKSLVLSSHVFTELKDLGVPELNTAWMWKHALAVGTLARAIAQDVKLPPAGVEMAFTAGLLHDCGMLMLAANRPEDYCKAIALGKERGSLGAAETEVFGADHASVGAYLLGLWALPEPIVEAVAFHHNPMLAVDPTMGPSSIVHIAGGIVDEMDAGDEGQFVAAGETLSMEIVNMLDVADKLDGWRALAAKLGSGE